MIVHGRKFIYDPISERNSGEITAGITLPTSMACGSANGYFVCAGGGQLGQSNGAQESFVLDLSTGISLFHFTFSQQAFCSLGKWENGPNMTQGRILGSMGRLAEVGNRW